MFTAALPTIIAKLGKPCKCPKIDEWIKKIWYLHIRKYCSAIKKVNGKLAICEAWKELGNVQLSDVSQTGKENTKCEIHKNKNKPN